GWTGMDCGGSCCVCNLETRAGTCRGLSLRWRYDGPVVRSGRRYSDSPRGHVVASVYCDDRSPRPDHTKPHLGSHERTTRTRTAVPCIPLNLPATHLLPRETAMSL